MQNKDSSDHFRTIIVELKNKKEAEGALLKAEVHQAIERVKPINLIKSTFREVSTSKELENHIAKAAIVLISSYLSRKLFVRMASSPLKRLLGAVVLFGITNAMAKHPEKVKAVGRGLYNLVRYRKRDRIEQ